MSYEFRKPYTNRWIELATHDELEGRVDDIIDSLRDLQAKHPDYPLEMSLEYSENEDNTVYISIGYRRAETEEEYAAYKIKELNRVQALVDSYRNKLATSIVNKKYYQDKIDYYLPILSVRYNI